jgi:hypothetical protein
VCSTTHISILLEIHFLASLYLSIFKKGELRWRTQILYCLLFYFTAVECARRQWRCAHRQWRCERRRQRCPCVTISCVVRLKQAYCMTCATDVLVIAQGPASETTRVRVRLGQSVVHKVRGRRRFSRRGEQKKDWCSTLIERWSEQSRDKRRTVLSLYSGGGEATWLLKKSSLPYYKESVQYLC